MFRRAITRLAAAFPPKSVSERLLPWGTLLTAALGAAWAIHVYSNNVAIARVTATIEFHKRYTDKLFSEKNKVADVLGRSLLRARCEFIRSALAEGTLQSRDQYTLNCENIDEKTLKSLQQYDLQGNLRVQARRYIFSYVGRHPLSATDASYLEQLSICFRSIIVCVEHRNCDSQTTIALFAREMVEFVNMTCPFDDQNSSSGKTINDEIARFLVHWGVHKNIYWSLDPGREKLFACDKLRALE